MANTITVGTVTRGAKQFQGAFTEMWTVNALISDQDAVAIGDTLALTVAVTGVALGDAVIASSVDVDWSDGTDQAVISYAVTAADVLTMYIQADKGELAADALNGGDVKVLIGRPNW